MEQIQYSIHMHTYKFLQKTSMNHQKKKPLSRFHGLQRFQPVFQHPVSCRPQRLLVWQGLPVEAVAPVVVPAVIAKHRTPLADPLVAGGMDASGANFFTHCVKVQSTSSVMTFRPRESNTLVAMLCYETNPLRSPFFKNTLWTLHESLWHMIPYGNLWTSLWVRYLRSTSTIWLVAFTSLHQPKTRTIPQASPNQHIAGVQPLLNYMLCNSCSLWVVMSQEASLCIYVQAVGTQLPLGASSTHFWQCNDRQRTRCPPQTFMEQIQYSIHMHTYKFLQKTSMNHQKKKPLSRFHGLQRFQPVFQHPVSCRPQRLLVWQGLPVEAVAPVVVPAVIAKHRTPLADPLVAGGMDASGANFFTHCVKVQSTYMIQNAFPWRISSSSPFS